jgi:hypothetical protein
LAVQENREKKFNTPNRVKSSSFEDDRTPKQEKEVFPEGLKTRMARDDSTGQLRRVGRLETASLPALNFSRRRRVLLLFV